VQQQNENLLLGIFFAMKSASASQSGYAKRREDEWVMGGEKRAGL